MRWGRIRVSRPGDEHLLLGQGLSPAAPAPARAPSRPLVAGRAHGVEVGAEGGRVEVQVEPEQVDLAPAEGRRPARCRR